MEATEAPAFDVVLKADKKRLELLEEVCYFFIILCIYLIKHLRCLVNVWASIVGAFSRWVAYIVFEVRCLLNFHHF